MSSPATGNLEKAGRYAFEFLSERRTEPHAEHPDGKEPVV
jgi:hypothetical protein